MNVADIAIIGAVGLLALVGLKIGLLSAAASLGGYILGGFLATEYYSLVAPLFEGLTDAEWLRNGAAFVAILLVVAIVLKIVVGQMRRLMSVFILRWADHLAGAAAGATLAILTVGTSVYLLGGLNVEGAQDALNESSLASQVARASVISVPLCSNDQTEGCTSLTGFAGDFVGENITSKLDGMLGGYDFGTLAEVAKSGITGSGDGLVDTVKAAEKPQNDANPNDSDAIHE